MRADLIRDLCDADRAARLNLRDMFTIAEIDAFTVTLPCLTTSPDDGGVELPYVCTLDRGHDGEHVAMDTDDETVYARWAS